MRGLAKNLVVRARAASTRAASAWAASAWAASAWAARAQASKAQTVRAQAGDMVILLVGVEVRQAQPRRVLMSLARSLDAS